jgi:hypothetical protein
MRPTREDLLASDHGHAFILAQLSSSYQTDKQTQDFFQATQHHSRDKISDVQPFPGTHMNRSHLYPQSRLGDLHAYPSPVVSAIRNAARNDDSHIFFSGFSNENVLYCTIDNSIYIWQTSGASQVQIIRSPNDSPVSAVAVGQPCSAVFDESVSRLIVYCTSTSISVVPVLANWTVADQSLHIHKTVGFVPTSVSGYSPILVGSNAGDIYELAVDPMGPEIQLANLTAGFLASFLPNFLRWGSPVTCLCYDDTTSCLAALDSRSNLRFFVYAPGQLTQVSTESAVSDEIVSLNAIPNSESLRIRFAAVTRSGIRVLYGTSPGMFGGTRAIHRLEVRHFHPDFEGHQIVGASISALLSVLLFEDALVVLRSRPESRSVSTASELFECSQISGGLLNVVVASHAFSNENTALFHHELMWQHVCIAPTAYILEPEGWRILTIERPVDVLQSSISRGEHREWMHRYREGGESAATALLLASENPAAHRLAITVLIEFGREELARLPNVDGRFSTASCGFIVRATRMLTIIWDSAVFKRHKSVKWQVTPIFITAGDFLIHSCNDFIGIANEFLSAKRAVNDRGPDAYREICQESTVIQKLVSFVQDTTILLKLLAVVAREKRAITETMDAVSAETRHRLALVPFGDPESTSVFEAIRDFARVLVQSHPQFRRDIETIYQRHVP